MAAQRFKQGGELAAACGPTRQPAAAASGRALLQRWLRCCALPAAVRPLWSTRMIAPVVHQRFQCAGAAACRLCRPSCTPTQSRDTTARRGCRAVISAARTSFCSQCSSPKGGAGCRGTLIERHCSATAAAAFLKHVDLLEQKPGEMAPPVVTGVHSRPWCVGGAGRAVAAAAAAALWAALAHAADDATASAAKTARPAAAAVASSCVVQLPRAGLPQAAASGTRRGRGSAVHAAAARAAAPRSSTPNPHVSNPLLASLPPHPAQASTTPS